MRMTVQLTGLQQLRGTAALVADGLDAMLAGQDEEGDGDDGDDGDDGAVDFEEMEGA